MFPEIQDLIDHSRTLKRLGGLKRHPQYLQLQHLTSFLSEQCSVAQRLWHVNNQQLSIPTCKMCISPRAWEKTNGGYYRIYCSNKCAITDPDRLSKIQQTNLAKYGSVSPFGSTEVQQRSKVSVKERYGVENVSQDPKINEKRKNTLFNNRNAHANSIEQITQMIAQGYTQTQIGEELGITQPRVSSLLAQLDLTTIKVAGSVIQREVVAYLTPMCDDIHQNDRSLITPLELDIVIPSQRLAIEVNGTYYHSELAGKHKRYHLDKTNQCKNIELNLIHISDHDWLYKKDIVKSRLCNALGIRADHRYYARQCIVTPISCATANEFINQHHIGGSRNASINLGLFHNGILLSVMTFSRHPRYQYEMVRFCSNSTTNVIGGAGKIFSYFIKHHTPSSVITFADLRWGEGNSYRHLNFTFDGFTSPNYWYFLRNGNTTKTMSRLRFQKHKLCEVLPQFDPSLTEWENMQNNGFDRIWDCGNARWIWSGE